MMPRVSVASSRTLSRRRRAVRLRPALAWSPALLSILSRRRLPRFLAVRRHGGAVAAARGRRPPRSRPPRCGSRGRSQSRVARVVLVVPPSSKLSFAAVGTVPSGLRPRFSTSCRRRGRCPPVGWRYVVAPVAAALPPGGGARRRLVRRARCRRLRCRAACSGARSSPVPPSFRASVSVPRRPCRRSGSHRTSALQRAVASLAAGSLRSPAPRRLVVQRLRGHPSRLLSAAPACTPFSAALRPSPRSTCYSSPSPARAMVARSRKSPRRATSIRAAGILALGPPLPGRRCAVVEHWLCSSSRFARTCVRAFRSSSSPP